MQLLGSSRAWSWAAERARSGIEVLIVLVVLFVAVVCGVVFITLGPAAHSHAKRQARPRPPRLRRHPAVPAAAGESGRRDADHLRQQLADVSAVGVQRPLTRPIPRSSCSASCTTSSSAARRSSTTCCTSCLIYFFCYFWTAITFNPKDMADNLKNFGTFIPGYRPGQADGRLPGKGDGPHHVRRGRLLGGGGHHADDRSPASFRVDYQVASFYGGTGLLIAVSVAFDLVQKIDSHLVMRNYRGLLEELIRVSTAAPQAARSAVSRGRRQHADSLHRSARCRQRDAGPAAGRPIWRFPTCRPATCCASAQPTQDRVGRAGTAIHEPGQAGARRGRSWDWSRSGSTSPIASAATCSTAFPARWRRPKRSTSCWPRAARRWTAVLELTASPTRSWCAGWPDAAAPTISPRSSAQRLEEYRQQTAPLLDYYRRAGHSAHDRRRGHARAKFSSGSARPSTRLPQDRPDSV